VEGRPERAQSSRPCLSHAARQKTKKRADPGWIGAFSMAACEYGGAVFRQ